MNQALQTTNLDTQNEGIVQAYQNRPQDGLGIGGSTSTVEKGLGLCLYGIVYALADVVDADGQVETTDTEQMNFIESQAKKLGQEEHEKQTDDEDSLSTMTFLGAGSSSSSSEYAEVEEESMTFNNESTSLGNQLSLQSQQANSTATAMETVEKEGYFLIGHLYQSMSTSLKG